MVAWKVSGVHQKPISNQQKKKKHTTQHQTQNQTAHFFSSGISAGLARLTSFRSRCSSVRKVSSSRFSDSRVLVSITPALMAVMYASSASSSSLAAASASKKIKAKLAVVNRSRKNITMLWKCSTVLSASRSKTQT